MTRVFSSRRTRRTALLWIGALALVFVGSLVLVRTFAPSLSDPEAVREFVLEFGVFAPVAFLFLQAAQVIVAPIPGQVLGFVAGYLFGPVWGTVYSVAGAVAGSFVAFVLSRRYGRSYVARMVDPEFLDQFDDVAGEQGEIALLIAFLVPGLPDDAICFVAGLTEMNIERMVLISLVGRLPGYFLIALAGAGIASRNFAQSAALILALAALSVVGYLRRDRILGWIRRDDGGPDGENGGSDPATGDGGR